MDYFNNNTQKKTSALLKSIIVFSRIFVGVVFVFSGYVKLIDPLGTAYKFGDYFTDAFHLPELVFLSLPLSFIMNIVEFITGASLLLNVKTKISSWLAMLFMLLFTPLTLYIAIFDNVHDCGCFGDALVLSNWGTFYKNLIIIVFVGILFIYKDRVKSRLAEKAQWGVAIALMVIALGFEVYNYRHLPIKDFRPYKIGSHLPSGMIIPDGEKPPVYGYNYTLTNKETKETKIVDSESYLAKELWKDTNWEITNTSEPIKLKDGYVPPIHDLRLEASEDDPKGMYQQGDDLLDMALADENYSFWIVMYDMAKVDIEELKQVGRIIEFSKQKGYNFYCLTSTSLQKVKSMQNEANVSFPVFNTDPITLKTIVRANPGYVLLKNGTVLAKWHNNDMPENEDLSKAIQEADKRLTVR